MVYVQGAKSVGCNLQPIAAVRRVGTDPNIVCLGCTCGGVEIWG